MPFNGAQETRILLAVEQAIADGEGIDAYRLRRLARMPLRVTVDTNCRIDVEGGGMVEPRSAGTYAGAGIFLPQHDGYSWRIVRDELGATVAVCEPETA